jgi:hypothetical protein
VQNERLALYWAAASLRRYDANDGTYGHIIKNHSMVGYLNVAKVLILNCEHFFDAAERPSAEVMEEYGLEEGDVDTLLKETAALKGGPLPSSYVLAADVVNFNAQSVMPLKASLRGKILHGGKEMKDVFESARANYRKVAEPLRHYVEKTFGCTVQNEKEFAWLVECGLLKLMDFPKAPPQLQDILARRVHAAAARFAGLAIADQPPAARALYKQALSHYERITPSKPKQ